MNRFRILYNGVSPRVLLAMSDQSERRRYAENLIRSGYQVRVLPNETSLLDTLAGWLLSKNTPEVFFLDPAAWQKHKRTLASVCSQLGAPPACLTVETNHRRLRFLDGTVLNYESEDDLGEAIDVAVLLRDSHLSALHITAPKVDPMVRSASAPQPDRFVDTETSLFSGAYLRHRVREETLRTNRHSGLFFSLLGFSFLDTPQNESSMHITELAALLLSYSRGEDTLCRTADGELILFCPMTSEAERSALEKRFKTTFLHYRRQGSQLPFVRWAGVTYPSWPSEQTDLIQALRDALDEVPAKERWVPSELEFVSKRSDDDSTHGRATVRIEGKKNMGEETMSESKSQKEVLAVRKNRKEEKQRRKALRAAAERAASNKEGPTAAK